MKYLKLLLVLLFAVVFPATSIACSNKTKETETKIFVGIAFYQKLDGNLNWSKFSEKPNAINNIISTQNNIIVLDESPELLFYAYTQNEITPNTADADFISNTTKDKISISNNNLTFRLERMVEDTEILIYYIYKLKDDSYYLEHVDKKSNVSQTTETFELDISHSLFSKVTLVLETNLTIKNEY